MYPIISCCSIDSAELYCNSLDLDGIDDWRLPTKDELYELYSDISKELMIDQLTQRRISDLINELEMLGIINCRVVSKGRYGRTKEISLSVPIREIREVLSNDYRISEVIDRKRR